MTLKINDYDVVQRVYCDFYHIASARIRLLVRLDTQFYSALEPVKSARNSCCCSIQWNIIARCEVKNVLYDSQSTGRECDLWNNLK